MFRALLERKGIVLAAWQEDIARQIFSKGRGTGKSLLIALLAATDDDFRETIKDLYNKK